MDKDLRSLQSDIVWAIATSQHGQTQVDFERRFGEQMIDALPYALSDLIDKRILTFDCEWLQGRFNPRYKFTDEFAAHWLQSTSGN